MRKRGVYFTIDAVLAAGILFAVLIFASRVYISEPPKAHVSFLSQDAVSVFTNLKVKDIENDYVQSLVKTKAITRENNTILEQIGEFWAEDDLELAANFSRNVTDALIPERFGVGVYVDGEEIYSRSKPVSRTLISSRKIISGIEKQKPTEGFTSKVALSGILSKTTNAYSYFGGFEGEGNLTKKLILPNNVIDIVNVTLEVNAGDDFDLYVNDIFSGSYIKGSAGGSGSLLADEFIVNQSYFGNFNNGTNIFTLNFTSEKRFISGGFLRVRYTTSSINDTVEDDSQQFWLPGIDGLINYYSSYYAPGSLNNMEIHLEFDNSFPIFFRIGNTTVYSNTTSGQTTIDIDNSTLSGTFSSVGVDYSDLSLKTIPIRLGLDLNGTALGGDADVILITDVSGSMTWRLDNDGILGVSRGCNDPNLFDSDTDRISLAKCLDKEFVDNIFNKTANTTNRIGLVSYSGLPNFFGTANSNTIVSTHDLSSDNVSLKNEIDGYSADGATGICGAIRQARLMLEGQSNPGKNKFIVVMADGLANVECDSTDEDNTVGCLPYECPSTGFCSADSDSCLYRVAEEIGSRSAPSLGMGFNDSVIMIAGESTGTFNGYLWDGVKWVPDASYAAGLGDVGSTSAPALAFNLTGDDTWTLIAGESAGTFNGYYWSGTQWISDSSRAAGLGDVGSDSNPTMGFNLTGDDTWTLIAGEDSGTFNGYYWSGTQWISDSSRAAGLGDVGRESTPDLSFNLTGDDTWTLIAGESAGTFNGYYWSGTQWISDSSRAAGLGDVGSDSSPLVGFNITGDNNWKLITGLSDGRYFSYYFNNSWFFMCRDFISNKAFTDAESDACKAAADTGAKIFSIGFGPVSKCPIASSGLETIAACGKGSYFASTSPNDLQKIYSQIAEDIIESSQGTQILNVTQPIYTSLSPDSYIQLNYSPVSNVGFGKVPLSFETERFGNNVTTGTLFIPENTSAIDAKVTSYSGDKWTDNLVVNGQTVYALSDYNANYTRLGDPFIVQIPVGKLSTGNNPLTISTGISPLNSTGGSPDNKAIYTLGLDSFVDFTDIVSKSEGCKWTVQYEDNTTDTINIPGDYAGSNTCNFKDGVFDGDDSINLAVNDMLNKLDLDNDKKLDIKIDEGSIDLESLTITNVPSLWGPAIVEIRIWE